MVIIISVKRKKLINFREAQEMKKTDAKEIARDILQDALAVAYYRIDID